MSKAERAYGAALEEIERVKAAGETALRLDGEDFRALERLPEAVGEIEGLLDLRLDNTSVTDLTPLAGLTRLQTLRLSNTNAADLTPLAGLTRLQWLWLDHTSVTDLTPLAGLTGLQTLRLNHTSVTDLTPLAGLFRLRELLLTNTGVTDLTPLAGLTGLQELYVNNTDVTDLTPLAGLAELQGLRLDNTNAADLTPLAGLDGLRGLSLDHTDVTDLTPLVGLTRLQRLDLDHTDVTDLTPLAGLTGLQTLTLSNTNAADLTPLAGLTGLQTLRLNNTNAADLTPLAGLAGLQRLWLTNTSVTDLTPLAGLDGLQQLLLNQTSVTDLRPIAGRAQLADSNDRYDGLRFADTPAARATPDLARLAAIEDGRDCARQTLAYLQTLPPWPEPLPWAIPDAPLPSHRPNPPDPDAVPRLILTEDQRLDVAESRSTEADLEDPIKARLYARLPEAVETLTRHANLYPEVDLPARDLKDLVALPFAEADLLDIHLAIAALTDIVIANADRGEAEQIDADCLGAIKAVTRLGPPITLGHPDVDLFEKRSLDYARTRRLATVAEGERRVTGGLAKETTLTTERTRAHAAFVAGAGDTGRLADYRSSFTRNAVIALSLIAPMVGNEAVNIVAGDAIHQAAAFLVAQKDAIMAIAPAWGEQGGYWAADLIARAKRILDAARGGQQR